MSFKSIQECQETSKFTLLFLLYCMCLSLLDFLCISSVFECAHSKKKISLSRKTKKFDYKNSQSPCSDSNPDTCTYLTLDYWNRLLYHCAILSVSEIDWACWLLKESTSTLCPRSRAWVGGKGWNWSVKNIGDHRTADCMHVITNPWHDAILRLCWRSITASPSPGDSGRYVRHEWLNP